MTATPQTLLSPSSPVPLYHQIAMLMRSRILEGDYSAGSALPTEEALRIEFNVSRATIRQAFGELVQSGIVTRRRGAGTWVRPGTRQRIDRRFRGSLAVLLGEGRAQIDQVQIVRRVQAPARIADLLKLDAGLVTLIRRTWVSEDQPLAYKLNYLPPPYGRTFTKRRLAVEPHLMRLLEAEGATIARAVQFVRARAADHEISRHLRVAIGDPTLFVERIVFESGGRPIEVAQTWYRSDAYEYPVTFDLTKGQGAEADLA